jgi:CYTH domain-containing protein
LEIERKFLVISDDWRPLVVQSLRISDGILMNADGCKLRVRLTDDHATLAFKGRRNGLLGEEVELPLDVHQARHLLDHHCVGHILSKTRHLVPKAELTWEIDVYDAPLQGIILAEVELPTSDHPVVVPDWIGAEVTSDPAWRKVNMVAAFQARVHA